jgi:RimJ/RimL family protein N-acetyltransferase
LYSNPPKGLADIATFARTSPKIRGVGSALFPATRAAAAEEFGLEFVNATIRADNGSGLAYYAKMGFEIYDRLVQIPLLDGTPVDRIKKRFVIGAKPHTTSLA